MKVIDISAWQEYIDWDKVKQENIEGVIIKIGEYDYLDEMFIEHVNNAVKYGLKYGVYYYSHASNQYEAVCEAHTVDEWMKTYLRGETPELGIWYDCEDKDMTAEDINVAQIAMSFVNKMTEIGYTYVGIYSSWNWFDGAKILPVTWIPDYTPLWVANYSSRNYLKEDYPNKSIKAWQFTSHYSDELPYDGNVYYD